MKTKLFSALLFSALLIAGCDKVKFPREGTTQNGGGGPEVYTRKVLVEDYTGHYCGTCPPAAVAAKNIQDQYGEQVVVVSVHAEFLAGLFPPIYTYDFRTTEGNDYDIFFGLQATPTGMVNRRNYPTSNHFLSYSTWAGNVASILPNPVETKIEIENTYNTGNRQLTSTIKSKMLTAHSGLYKLVVWITEDSIIKPQKDNSQNPSDILNYVHRHVLRGSMNSTWGDTAFVGNILVNDSTSHTYTLTLNSGWNENRCHVVAYIYDDDPLSATYKEVLQVEEKHVVH